MDLKEIDQWMNLILKMKVKISGQETASLVRLAWALGGFCHH